MLRCGRTDITYIVLLVGVHVEDRNDEMIRKKTREEERLTWRESSQDGGRLDDIKLLTYIVV